MASTIKFLIDIHFKSLQKLMIDMETGERGFLLAGRDEFLEPYNSGWSQFQTLITKQKKLVFDNPPFGICICSYYRCVDYQEYYAALSKYCCIYVNH
ncbi:MAG: CHASE3 domain-containing protein [Spirochaetota bacterium]